MRIIAITSLLFATSQVAVSAPIYSLARRAPDGGDAAIPAWNDVVQRDENDEDLFAREVAQFYPRESFSDTHDGLLRRTLKRRAAPEEAGNPAAEGADAAPKPIDDAKKAQTVATSGLRRTKSLPSRLGNSPSKPSQSRLVALQGKGFREPELPVAHPPPPKQIPRNPDVIPTGVFRGSRGDFFGPDPGVAGEPAFATFPMKGSGSE